MPDDYPLPSGDPASLGFAATPLQHLDRLIRQHIEENRYPGAQIALARHGKLALFRSYGNAKTEHETVPATGQTLFLLFSQTKVLTSCAVWMLIEEGKLSFMDRIADHLPEFAQRGKAEITLHQVMTHQGGFPSGDVTRATWTDHTRMRAEVCEFSLDWTPGTRLQYHPRAAHLTQAMVIEAVTGQDYREVIREKVLAPLGLAGEIFVGVPAKEQGRCADTYAAEPRDNSMPRRAGWRPSIRCCSGAGGSGMCDCCRRGWSAMSRAATPENAATMQWAGFRCIAASARMSVATATASAASARSPRRRPSGTAVLGPPTPGRTRRAACRSPTSRTLWYPTRGTRRGSIGWRIWCTQRSTER